MRAGRRGEGVNGVVHGRNKGGGVEVLLPMLVTPVARPAPLNK